MADGEVSSILLQIVKAFDLLLLFFGHNQHQSIAKQIASTILDDQILRLKGVHLLLPCRQKEFCRSTLFNLLLQRTGRGEVNLQQYAGMACFVNAFQCPSRRP